MKTLKSEATVNYTVEPGRNIYRDGEPFISIHKTGSTAPVTADEVTHVIAAALNQIQPQFKYESKSEGSRPDIGQFRKAFSESLSRREGVSLNPQSRMAVQEQSGNYAWVIVDPPNYVGLMGPRGATMTAQDIKAQGEKFRMYDDDGEFMAAGYIAGDYDGFEPMDDWGQPGLGATEIKYKGPSGAWETL